MGRGAAHRCNGVQDRQQGQRRRALRLRHFSYLSFFGAALLSGSVGCGYDQGPRENSHQSVRPSPDSDAEQWGGTGGTNPGAAGGTGASGGEPSLQPKAGGAPGEMGGTGSSSGETGGHGGATGETGGNGGAMGETGGAMGETGGAMGETGGDGGASAGLGGAPSGGTDLSLADLVGSYEIHFRDLPQEAACLNLEQPSTLTVLGGEEGITTRYAPYLSRWRYFDAAIEQEPQGGARVTFVEGSRENPIELSLAWTPEGPENPGEATLQSYCEGTRVPVPVEFDLLPDTAPPQLHLRGWMEPDVVFSFTSLSLWFTEAIVWDEQDWPWTCIESASAASTLVQFSDASGDEVPFVYEGIWACTGIRFDQELVRGQILTLHLDGNGRDLAGHALSLGTQEIYIRDAGLPQTRFDFSEGMPPGLHAIDPSASVYHVPSGPPCEQGACVVMETVAQRCTTGPIVASAVLGIRVDHSTHQHLSARYRIESSRSASPYLGYQMQIPQTAFGEHDAPLALEPDPTLDAPYTHASAWTPMGLSHSSADMGYAIALDCWQGADPPPQVRVIIDRIVPADEF